MCAGCPGDLPQAVYAAVWMSCRRRDGSGQSLRLNSDPGVGNFEMKTFTFVVERADGDLSALGGEFHRVVDQVPKHLLKPDAISQDVILFRLQLGRDVQLLRRDR